MMKTYLKTIFLSAAALLLATAVHAYDFTVVNEDGWKIYYNIIDNREMTCEVSGCSGGGGTHGTVLNIPEKVNYSSLTFTVTKIKSVRNLWMESITIPNSITSIAPTAFMGSEKLQRVKLPDFLTNIEDSVFSECSALTSVEIPTTVHTIGKRAFYNCQSLSSVVIPNTVTTIGEAAFWGCLSLTSVEIPNSVTTLQNNAFSYCQYLTSVKLSNAITSISVGLFESCSKLTSIEIPNSVTSIGQYAFEGCFALTSVKISESVTSIGNNAFQGCFTLTSVKIPESVTSIGSYAFSCCEELTSIDIPNSVTMLGSYAFEHCYALSSVHLSNSLSSIGTSTFSWCIRLKSVEIPSSVTSIGDNAFYYCALVSSIVIPNSVTEIGNNAFFHCEDLPSVRLPNSLKTIKRGAFSNCYGLTTVEIPDSVTSIESSAFEGCKSLKSVTLGSSIESIGEQAFASCNALEKVDTRIETPFKINENVFPTRVKMVAILHVPKGRKAVYRATAGWSDFVIVEEDGLYFHLTMPSDENFLAFCHDEPLDFSIVSGLKAYIAGGIDSSNGEVMMMSVEKVPAGTGVILQGTAGSSYDILVEKTSFVYFNLLKGTLSQTTISDGYVLRGDRFEQVSTPTTVAANSAYLVLPASVQGAQTLALRLKNGVTDDIDAVVTDVAGGNDHWYTLQGARLNGTPTTPGIYIRNGRKVWVK